MVGKDQPCCINQETTSMSFISVDSKDTIFECLEDNGLFTQLSLCVQREFTKSWCEEQIDYPSPSPKDTFARQVDYHRRGCGILHYRCVKSSGNNEQRHGNPKKREMLFQQNRKDGCVRLKQCSGSPSHSQFRISLASLLMLRQGETLLDVFRNLLRRLVSAQTARFRIGCL